jgi:hypothetical protein
MSFIDSMLHAPYHAVSKSPTAKLAQGRIVSGIATENLTKSLATEMDATRKGKLRDCQTLVKCDQWVEKECLRRVSVWG